MNEALRGKKVESYDLRDIERMVKIGFIMNVSDFGDLVGRKITSVTSRGNTIRVRLDGGTNLLIGPEYGGVIRLVGEGGEIQGLPLAVHDVRESVEAGLIHAHEAHAGDAEAGVRVENRHLLG